MYVNSQSIQINFCFIELKKMLMNKVNGQQDKDGAASVVKATSPDSLYTNLANNMQFIKKQQETNSSLNNMDNRTVVPSSGINSTGGSNSSASSTTSSGNYY